MAESVGVIGAGITGLAAAYVLSPKYNVTIVARDLPGDLGADWASPWAGAVFHPQKNATKAQQEMQTKSFNFYWDLAKKDPSSGVKVYQMTEYRDDQDDDSNIWYKPLLPDYRLMSKSELPAGVTLGLQYTTVAMNPLLLLPWLKEKLIAKGVKFVRAEIKSFDEARNIAKSKIIINASGVGAKQLVGDDTVGPVRGQTMFVKTDFSKLIMMEGSEYTYIIPRALSGGVIIGGIKSDRVDTEVDIPLKSDILRRVNRISKGAFKDVDLDTVTDIVGFRPGRKEGIRVEREGDIVHAYGVEGAGYIYSFGIAEAVKELVEGFGFKSKL
ncbi:putative D-amino acid oxidase [Mollisia scopiformis]|uniref:Putative D-amino acid oxidase n=1 Tax=Mollisia scopiformis TaxID=149040 RepID=A0A194XK35_MOLSC|nr:putative D-amino acid oxidase [Mollisia scopiformis]KUJ20501.1 putative D-amino acid oxidase [Mollisia scopiformis]